MKNTFVLTTGAAFILAACAIKAPDIKLSGERTTMENQILGSYEDMKEDVWMVASVRSTEPAQKMELSESKRQSLEAVNNRRFNKDDIDEFKQKQFVGEDNHGFLTILENLDAKIRQGLGEDTDPQKAQENTAKTRKLVEDIITEENADRKVIMQRVIELNENLTDKDFAKVEQIFTKMNRDNAAPGDWIQQDDGAWTKKP
jgi:uncharacterized protein YdbL (DUF1318 family)